MGTNKDEKNQNNTSIILLAVALIVIVVVGIGLMLYNKGAQDGAVVPGGNGKQGQQEEQKKTETQETDFTQWVSDTIDGSYYIPSLLFDTDDARAINEEIAKECANRPQESTEESPFGIGYNTYCNQGILSLVVIISSPNNHYCVYNVDTETGLRLSNSDLLAKFGVKEESALEAVKSSTESLYRSQYVVEEEDEAYTAALNASLAEVNSSMAMYLDENTALASVIKLHEAGSENVSENLVVLGLDGMKD